MKKFWLVLLSLGLVMAFSVSAFAVDVKVSAEYYAAGLYLNKVTVWDGHEEDLGDYTHYPSTAFFFQRLRVGTDFVVSPCLKLVTRFDAMERIWGGARSNNGKADDDDDDSANSAGTRAENENIAFDLVYIDYTSPIGQFKVGYQPDMVWGTVFADFANGNPTGQIQYWKNVGPFTIAAIYSKEVDNSWSAVSAGSQDATRTDRDLDTYKLGGIYNFKDGEAGALLLWARDATNRGSRGNNNDLDHNYLTNIYVFDPYVKTKIGPVALQAEAQYWFGDMAKYEGYVANATNVSVSALSVFLDATANFGMFYGGLSMAYLSGQDTGKEDQVTGGINTAGLDWNPCLILFNNDLRYWTGYEASRHGYAPDIHQQMSNAWFGQLRAGVKPAPQWDVMLAVAYAQADKKPYDVPDGTYGTEIDLTANYKITNNLSYMMGFGYLFTGDFFKGDCDDGPRVTDDFLIINKLTLTF